jgi:hypothetical protein
MENVRSFIRTYPPLAENKLNVDFLPADARSYSVEAIPANDVLKTYLDGSTVRQFLFVLASRESYGGEVLQQLENLGFYEAFATWLYQQNLKKNFPALREGKMVTKIEATTPGYALSTGEDKARYQIQCRMEFMQRSDK